MSDPSFSTGRVLTAMLDALDDFLRPPVGSPPPGSTLPPPGLSVVSVSERTVGIGNRRGTDFVGPFAVLSLKGVRLEAVVRFQYWAADPAGADALLTGLHGRLAAGAGVLRTAGFLQVTAAGASPAELLETAWRVTADYRVLYEFRYQDADGAESLLSRIPIDIGNERAPNVTTTVSDDMVRWDDGGAPALVVRRRRAHAFRLDALSLLAFLPAGWDGVRVVMELTPPSPAQPPRFFNTVRDFVAAFTAEPEVVVLGGNTYVAGRMQFPNPLFSAPILLSGDADTFQVRYLAPGSRFDSAAVVYLRALG